MANRPAAIKSSRRIQCSSVSVQTMWQYRPDAIRCLTSSWISCFDTNRETATGRTEGQHRPDAIQVSNKLSEHVSVFLS
jgi:hypothetical protein